MKTNPSSLLTPEEAAKLVGLHRTTITAAITAKEIRAIRVGGQWRLQKAWLLRWLATGDNERTVLEPGVAHHADRVAAYRERRLQALLRGATKIAEIEPEPADIDNDLEDDG